MSRVCPINHQLLSSKNGGPSILAGKYSFINQTLMLSQHNRHSASAWTFCLEPMRCQEWCQQPLTWAIEKVAFLMTLRFVQQLARQMAPKWLKSRPQLMFRGGSLGGLLEMKRILHPLPPRYLTDGASRQSWGFQSRLNHSQVQEEDNYRQEFSSIWLIQW